MMRRFRPSSLGMSMREVSPWVILAYAPIASIGPAIYIALFSAGLLVAKHLALPHWVSVLLWILIGCVIFVLVCIWLMCLTFAYLRYRTLKASKATT